MVNLVLLLVFFLATYRLTRLVIEDEIFDTPRDWLYSKVRSGGKLEYLLGCEWCVSFWVAIPLAILYIFLPTGMMVVGLPLAGSAITGLIYKKVN